MRTLVTGAGGFAGPVVAAALRASGHSVIGLVRHQVPARLAATGSTIAHGDLLDPGVADRLLDEHAPDAVIHLAGLASGAAAEAAPIQAYRSNVEALLALLAAIRARTPQTRLLVVSSSEIYGLVGPDELPVTEDVPPRPVSVYAASRLAAEITAAQWARAHQLDVFYARAFNHTGPGQSAAFVCAALARQVAAIETGQQEPILRAGNLDVVRDFSDVGDIARGYVTLIEQGRPGRTYNLCSGVGVSIAEVIAVLQSHARVRFDVRSEPLLRRAVDVPRLVGTAARARDELGWVPRVALAETLAALLDDWRIRACS